MSEEVFSVLTGKEERERLLPDVSVSSSYSHTYSNSAKGIGIRLGRQWGRCQFPLSR